MSYTPNNDNPVRERVVRYLRTIDDAARPAKIADAVEASQSYIYQVMSDLQDEGVVNRHLGQHIIGHPMPDGGSVVLPTDREKLLDIIRRYDPTLLDDARDLDAPHIRTLIESEIAVGEPHPMGNRKVSYSLVEA